MKGHHGLTLAEVLIAGSISLVALGLLTTVFARLFNNSVRLHLRDDHIRQASLALQRIQNDMQSTHGEGVSLAKAPDVLGINPIVSVQDNGTIVWSKEFFLYASDNGKLLRRTWPGDVSQLTPAENNEGSAKLLNPLRIQEALTQNHKLVETLASDVLTFSISPNERKFGLKLPIQVELRMGPINDVKEQVTAKRLFFPQY